uniref:Serine/threonine specific protein phosphatases domain-containing protein n=1 Tax=Ditylenchus dipsaci TaxID=166011 RepID=A0A915CSU8_9BILA
MPAPPAISEASRLLQTQAMTMHTQAPTQAPMTQQGVTAIPVNAKQALKVERKRRIEQVNADGKIDALKDMQELHALCLRARERCMSERALLRVGANIFILGDIHGQFQDLKKVLSILGLPPKRRYLFLGDYVDRGLNSLETITLLLAMKLRYPRRVYLLRMPNRFGKEDGSRIWTDFQHVFNVMPVSAIVGTRIFCAHGGISQELVDWKQFDRMVRPTDVTDVSLLTDLLWSDPCPTIEYYAESPRNVSQVFGSKAVDEFCMRMGIDMIVRGHQASKDGYETFFNNRCVTIFSAPHYTDMKNRGALMYVSTKLQCSIYCYSKAESPQLCQTIKL